MRLSSVLLRLISVKLQIRTQQALDLSGCTTLASIAPLRSLVNMECLDLSCARHGVTDLVPLSELSHLRCLRIDVCKVCKA